MRKILAAVLALCVLSFWISLGLAAPFAGSTRIKDIAKVQGVRSNQLVGYGVVVGLAGTGDSTKTVQTMQSIANMLKTFGITVNAADMKAKNAAAVMVTAQLPPFVKPGDTIDITVSSMGDAKSLQGGILLQTPLRAANGQVYAVGQGPVMVGGFAAGRGGSSQQKNIPTVGFTANGAIVERDVPVQLASDGVIALALYNPDFTTASRVSEAIDSVYGPISRPRDPGTVEIVVPPQYASNIVGFVASIEELAVTPDSAAKVVINERTGTIVMGANVTIDEVAVAQGGLSVKISGNREVSQPNPFSGGKTAVTDNPKVEVKEQEASLVILPASSSVGDVVNALNAVGATPHDVISILQAIKAAGALRADFQVI